MRRVLRIILWVVKGVLLVVALAALVMWPVSRGRQMVVRAERDTAGPATGEYREYYAGCWDGRAVIGRVWRYAWSDRSLVAIRANVKSGGEGWRWARWSRASAWEEGNWPHRRGPLRCYFHDDNRQGMTGRYRHVAAPLWMLALAAGAWPLASIAFALRRRVKRRRAAMEGCCKHCGYDLRATPEKSGGLLAVCPECGKESRTT